MGYAVELSGDQKAMTAEFLEQPGNVGGSNVMESHRRVSSMFGFTNLSHAVSQLNDMNDRAAECCSREEAGGYVLVCIYS